MKKTSLLSFLPILCMICLVTEVKSQVADKIDTVSKSFLYYGLLDVYRDSPDTVYLEKDVIIFIDRKNGGLFFKKTDQPVFEIPKEYYNDISNYIFTNFLADDKYQILRRMTSMTGLMNNAKIGIDVASHQAPKPINWLKVKADTLNAPVEFVFIRSTLGYSNTYDPKFIENYNGAEKNGFSVGLYHNFVLNRKKNPDYMNQVRKQAYKFAGAFKGRNITFKPVFDIEEHPTYAVVVKHFTAKEIRQAAKAFIDIVEKELKTEVVIYTFESFYNKYLKGYFDDKNIWIARYPHSPGFAQNKSVPGTQNPFLGISYDFKHQKFDYNLKSKSVGWQFSENGKVNGILNDVDLSLILDKDYDKWLWVK